MGAIVARGEPNPNPNPNPNPEPKPKPKPKPNLYPNQVTTAAEDEPLMDHQDEPLSVTVMRKVSCPPYCTECPGVRVRASCLVRVSCQCSEVAAHLTTVTP